jgi:hypothetical protein
MYGTIHTAKRKSLHFIAHGGNPARGCHEAHVRARDLLQNLASFQIPQHNQGIVT